MDVSTWLRELGLENYAQAFRANDIDAEVLSRLTAEDLSALGITSVGHRRKLLDAIALLNTGTAPAAAGAITVTKRPAERRQLTVLFCDLVGSTELAARLDPEDLRDIMRAYQVACADVIGRFEGHIAKFLGDGVLAYFGWPRAHEDDAERAVRAGLALAQAVARLEADADTRLRARVGIATGPAVVGDLVGEGASREETVVGDVPNLAARLQTLAEPGTVVIGQATRRLLGGLFQLEDLGPQRLKGFAEALTAWRVIGEGQAEGRFEARQTAGLTPLVGREEEIALLLRRWQQAQDGDGQVVLLSGEPGIGKSRIVRELRARLEEVPHTRLLYQCSPHHTTSALHPVIEQLERAAGFAQGDPPEARLDKLEALLARGTGRADEAATLIAALLGLPIEERYPPLDLTPQRQKQRTLEVLVDQLEGLAAAQPVLVTYEDVHWIDPTTQELLGLTIERIQRLPVLAIITFRPDFMPPWPAQPYVSALALTRLGRRDGSAMVDRVVGDKALPAEVSAQIVAKTDGVPLFVEELTKTVLESGLLRDAGNRWEVSGPLPPLAIPSTLHDSLLARLDRLAPVKEVAQIGAALAREFSHALLAAVADQPEGELRAALDQLLQSELIFRRGTPPEATYSFKHALVQDAAYGTLLKSRRQQLHTRIAQVLEEQFPETVKMQPELLAHHCTPAGFVEKAIDYWHKAGRQAMTRSAMKEAVAHLTTALDLLACLPDGRERRRRELRLQVALGGAQMVAKGWASPEMGKAYARARDLCRELGEAGQLFPALFGLRQLYLNRAEVDAAHVTAEELLRLAQLQDDASVTFLGHLGVGVSLLFRAEFDLALEHLERVIAGYDPPKHRTFMDYGAADLCVGSRSFASWILLFQGHPDRALAYSRQALAMASELAHPYTLAFALHVNCLFNQVYRDAAAVEECSAALMALAAEQGFPHLLGTGTFFHGWAATEGRTAETSIEEMPRGLAAKRATGAEIKVPYYLGLLASVYGRMGQPAQAMPLLAEALGRVERSNERWFEAELHRLQGETLLRMSPKRAGDAEVCYRKSLGISQQQNAKLWELRAAMSLARLWAEQGERRKAYDLLAPIYGWFSEGFDTADLKDAKALLDQLA